MSVTELAELVSRQMRPHCPRTPGGGGGAFTLLGRDPTGRAHTGVMKPNNGVVVRGVHVLLSSKAVGQQRWYWWLVSLVTELQGDAERRRYEVRALAADTSAALATRAFDRESTARQARDRFVELLEQDDFEPMDPHRVQALLDSVQAD